MTWRKVAKCWRKKFNGQKLEGSCIWLILNEALAHYDTTMGCNLEIPVKDGLQSWDPSERWRDLETWHHASAPWQRDARHFTYYYMINLHILFCHYCVLLHLLWHDYYMLSCYYCWNGPILPIITVIIAPLSVSSRNLCHAAALNSIIYYSYNEFFLTQKLEYLILLGQ